MDRLEEVKTLLTLAKQVSRKLPLPQNVSRVNALCRSGVVLLSSHIEGYIEELGTVALERIVQKQLPKTNLGAGFRYYLSRDLIIDIQSKTDPAGIAEVIDKLNQRDQHIWGTQSHFDGALTPDIFLNDFANPTHERIRKFFNRFGYDNFQRDMQRELKANFSSCSNMINQIVDQRNKIAHGDSLTSGTPLDLSQMIHLSKTYCRTVDCVVANWFRNQGCSIR